MRRADTIALSQRSLQALSAETLDATAEALIDKNHSSMRPNL